MFSFLCSKCGNLEMLHPESGRDLEEDLRRCIETGLWPDEEYQEELRGIPSELSQEELLQLLLARKKGYRFSLKTCCGFEYRKKDSVGVIKEFCTKPNMSDYLPETLRPAFEKRLELFEK